MPIAVSWEPSERGPTKRFLCSSRRIPGVDAACATACTSIGHLPGETEQARLQEAVQRFGVEDEAGFLGLVPHDDIPAHLRAMRIYVQCSEHEGLPNAVLEAASLGVPIVATNVGGLRDILRDRENALVVPKKDREALAAAITELLSDDALAMRLSQGAVELARSLNPANEKQAWL